MVELGECNPSYGLISPALDVGLTSPVALIPDLPLVGQALLVQPELGSHVT